MIFMDFIVGIRFQKGKHNSDRSVALRQLFCLISPKLKFQVLDNLEFVFLHLYIFIKNLIFYPKHV